MVSTRTGSRQGAIRGALSASMTCVFHALMQIPRTHSLFFLKYKDVDVLLKAEPCSHWCHKDCFEVCLLLLVPLVEI